MITETINDIGIYVPKYVMIQQNPVLLQPQDIQDENSKNDSAIIHDEENSTQGAGFGDSLFNKIVEEAAINFVTKQFEEMGWVVTSKELEKCGYDLHCISESSEKHVEVKGVSGKQISFQITSGEVERARMDEDFLLCVVTSAVNNPSMKTYTGKTFFEQFNLKIISYFATPLDDS